MDGHRAILFTLSMLAAAVVLSECRPHQHNGASPHQPHHSPETDISDCQKCKPGYHVRHKCNHQRDTVCAPCKDGTYSSEYNLSDSCSMCSQCDKGSFISKKCTETQDTICEWCATEYPPDTHEFREKCSQYLSYIMSDENIDFHIDDVHSLPSDGSGDPESMVLSGKVTSVPLPESSDEAEDEGADEDVVDSSSSGSGSDDSDIDLTLTNMSISMTPGAKSSPPRTTTEAEEEDGSGFGGMLVKPGDNMPAKTVIATLPPDLGAEEDLIPVTITKMSHVTSSSAKSTDRSALLSTQSTKTPLRLKLLPINDELGKPEEDDTAGLSEDKDEGSDIEEVTTVTDHHGNGSDKEGKRRRPLHTEETTKPLDEDVSAGAIKEGENKQNKGVSHFAVIAAALISAIVFFILGFVSSKLKDRRRGAVKLPQPEVQLLMPSGNDNESPPKESVPGASVYAVVDHPQINKTTATNTELDVYTEQEQPKVNPFKAEADIEKHPDTERYSVPMKDLSTKSPSAAVASPSGPRMSQIKFMDETDDELETDATRQNTPLLSPSEKAETETERSDLASQVLSTVDKNLNADSEKESLLNGGSSTEVTTENVHT